MNTPEKSKHDKMPMPDSFGTGKQPIRQKSYLPMTLILLVILLGANLVAFAVHLRLQNKDRINAIKNVLLPGSDQIGAFSGLIGGDKVQAGIHPSGQTLSDAEIVKKLLPSLVRITAQTDSETAIGTGLVLTRDGYILTNSHSVETVHALCVILSDGSSHTAVCVGSDGSSDLAVLKIEAETLEPAELGDSSEIQSGDRLHLLSYSGELKEATVIKADDSAVLGGEQTRMLVVDLSEEGVLINQSGQVVAIQIGEKPRDGKALPICTAKELANDLISYGCINPQASLGVQIAELNDIQRRYWQLPEGVMISQVVVNGSAYLAGIRPGDVLLQIDAKQIKNADDYQAAMELLHPGDTVQLLIYRMGREYSITIVLQSTR